MTKAATAFRIFLAGGWIILAAITVWALLELGPMEAVRTFIGDYGHPWRAQFYTDFSLHLFLVAAWILYRGRTPTLRFSS